MFTSIASYCLQTQPLLPKRDKNSEPFFQNVAPPPPSNEILLGRAKQHMRFKEWERAILCLDDILREPKDHPVGTEFVPDKEVRRREQKQIHNPT